MLIAIALTLAVAPGQALAAPQWRPAELREATGSGAPADVASDADGNSVAVWLGPDGTVEAAYRPRGGPWQPRRTSIPGPRSRVNPPLVTAQPNGQFVAVWLGDRRRERPSYPAALGAPPGRRRLERAGHHHRHQLLPGHRALEATADGSVTVASDRRGARRPRNTKPPGSEPWGSG